MSCSSTQRSAYYEAVHFDRISMELSILYYKGLSFKVSNKRALGRSPENDCL